MKLEIGMAFTLAAVGLMAGCTAILNVNSAMMFLGGKAPSGPSHSPSATNVISGSSESKQNTWPECSSIPDWQSGERYLVSK